VCEEEHLETDPPPSSGDPEVEEEEGPLVERLRHLEWPSVDPEIRQRAWERFQELMAKMDQQKDESEQPVQPETEQTATSEPKPPGPADDAEH
jgi:hypothetical protein